MVIGYKYVNRNRSADGTYHSFFKRTSKTQQEYLSTLSSSSIGWFSDLKDAQNSVIHNDFDMHEQNNQYVLIEKLVEGPYSCIDTEQWWYEWEYKRQDSKNDDGKYKLCKPPECCKGIIGYWNRTDSNKNRIPRIEFDYLLGSSSTICAKTKFNECCCSCKNHKLVHNHCDYTIRKKSKCSCSKELGFYVCCAPLSSNKTAYLSGPHGYCELYDKDSKTI